jgi:cell division protein FtsB
MKKNRLPLLILAVLVPLFIAGAVASFQKYRRIAEEFQRQETRLAELAKEKEVLQKSIEYFSSAVGIEHEARSRFNFVKEGEVTVILVSPKATPIEPSPLPEWTFLQKMLRWLWKR